MGFELMIAAKRDPAEGAEFVKRDEVTPAPVPSPVATLELSGAFTEASANELVQRIGEVLHNPADTLLVRFDRVACDDASSVRRFASWVDELQAGGHDVRLVSADPALRALLCERVSSPEVVLQPAEADALRRRRVVD